MKFFNTRFFGFFFLLFFLSYNLQGQDTNLNCDLSDCPSIPIDLNNWMQTGLPEYGNWTVTDGSSVIQSVNEETTFFVSPNDFINTSVEGSFRVNGSRDDDFIGFVFGYQSPNQDSEDFNFLLFDWKGGDQNLSGYGQGFGGYALSRFNGNFDSLTELRTTFWSKADNPALTVLATDYNTTKGWVHRTLYKFKLDYSSTNIKIYIDDVLIFDVNGNFPSGKFGFYNFSQPNVEYMSFTEAIECETFYADTDGDGFGDLNNTTIDCVVPDGFVANADDCDDNNPNVPAAIGTSCDDNDANTDNDIIQADSCICQGTIVEPIFTDNCNLKSGLLAYYPFNGNANDESGNGHNTTIIGNPSLINGVNGEANGAYEFDGNDVIEVTENIDDFRFNNSSLSISAWVTIPDNAPLDYYFMVSIGNPSMGVDLYKRRGGLPNGNLAFLNRIGSSNLFFADSKLSGGELPKNTWLHLVGITDVDSQKVKLYLDGELQQSIDTDLNLDFSNLSNFKVQFGAYTFDGGSFHKGNLDNVRIYNRALSDTEIQELYDCEKSADLCLNSGGDSDNDNICDDIDNCPQTPNPDQLNADNDTAGAACDCDDSPETGMSCTDGCQYFYRDNDGDNFGGQIDSILACIAPMGYVDNKMDCDDTNSNINPNGTEIACNGIDEDCNNSDNLSCAGKSLDLSTNNSWVNAGDLDVQGNQISIEALIYLNSNTISNIVSKHTQGSDVNYLLRDFQFILTTESQFMALENPVTLIPNRWYHVAGTYDGTAIKYYVDGCLVNEQPLSGNLVQNDLATAIGARSQFSDELFSGKIDELRIWNVSRSQTEIQANMFNIPDAESETNLLAYYKFDNALINTQGDTNLDGNAVGNIQYSVEETTSIDMNCSSEDCDLSDGLLAYYPFNGNANDESGNGHDAIPVGNPTLINGVKGENNGAYNFDGDDYFVPENQQDFKFNNQSITYSAWVTIDANENLYNTYIGNTRKNSSLDRPWITLYRSRSGFGGNIIFVVINEQNQRNVVRSKLGGNELPKNEWLHVIGILDMERNQITLYIDGELQERVDLPENFQYDLGAVDPTELRIGNWSVNPAFGGRQKGNIDNVRIYDRALSDTEVKDLFECEKGDMPPPPCDPILTQVFTTQAQLDSFVCDCNKTIEGDLIINGDSINDLSNLSCIKEVTGNVYIGDSLSIPSNDRLQTLDGLSGIMKIGGDLVICNNPALINLDGFSSLMEVGGDIQVKNCRVIEYIRFVSLTRVGGSCIYLNLPTLRFIGSAEFGIFGGFGLTSFGGGVRYENLPELVWITGFDGISEIRGDLYFINVPKLQSLEAYRRIIRLFGCLHLIQTTEIVDFSGLDSLELIGEDIRIMNNDQIRDLSQLGNLVTLNGSIIIMNNANLQDLNGLRNLLSVADTLKITDNPMLDNCCGINDLLRNNGVGGPVFISGNLAGCLNEMDINDNCTDEDGDGFSAIDDCNDNNPDIYPGATEILCDNIDSNCNGADECPPTCAENGGDADGDGVCANEDCDDNDPAISKEGDACDDGDATTMDDKIDANCACKGIPPMPCEIGTACDDGNAATINDTLNLIGMECVCQGIDTTTTADPDFCEEYDAYVGSSCDDDDPNTEDEWLEEGCKCVGRVINGCNLTIRVEGNSIIAENVDDDRNKVYLWDRTFSNLLDESCAYWTDCEGDQTFSDLLPGVYAVQYQSFSEDWTKLICDSLVYVEITGNTTTNACDDLDIKLAEKDLSINNLPTLNTVIDLFDSQYAIVFRCVGDCGTGQTIEDLAEGTYILRVKTYDVNWNFVCEIEEVITVAGVGIIVSDDRNSLGSTSIPQTSNSTLTSRMIKVSPNPASETIRVDLADFIGLKMDLMMMDMLGRVVLHQHFDKADKITQVIDIQSFKAGVYQVSVIHQGKATSTKLIIIQ